MRALIVVILAEIRPLLFQVTGIPEERLVKEFPPNAPDQSFDEGVR